MPQLERDSQALRTVLGTAPPHDVRWFDVVDSTNTVALDLLESGAARPPLAILAREQVAGRGRLGRVWLGDRDSLFLTLGPRIPGTPPPAPFLSMASGLALYDALRARAATARLKWPNDLLCDDAKLAGILVESRQVRGRAPVVVIGVGVNVNQDASTLPRPPGVRTTSLRLETGERVDLVELAAEILRGLAVELARFTESPEESAERYRRALGLDGRLVLVEAGSRREEGLLVRIDPRRGVVLHGDRGERVVPLELIGSLGPANP